MGREARLGARVATATAVRSLSYTPGYAAWRIERIRGQVDVMAWAGVLGGLAFTAVNVQAFAAAGAPAGSAGWWVAWLLDPMVSLVLLAVLRAEQHTARWGVVMGTWPRRARWFCLAATYVMNTWTAWGLVWTAGDLAGVVLHSVPPLVVFVAAEAVTDLRDKLTAAAHHAARAAGADPSCRAGHDASPAGAAVPDPHELNQRGATAAETTAGADPVTEPIPVTAASSPGTASATAPATASASAPAPTGGRGVHEPRPTAPRRAPARRSPARPARPAAGRSQTQEARAAGRVSAADYAWTARMALTPEVEITPAWVRAVTGCSRGLSSQLARTLRAEQDAADLDTADLDAADTGDGSGRAREDNDDTGEAPARPENGAQDAVNGPRSTSTDDDSDSTGAAGEHRTERPEGAGRERQVA